MKCSLSFPNYGMTVNISVLKIGLRTRDGKRPGVVVGGSG